MGAYLLTFRERCSVESCSEPAAASWGMVTETSITRGTELPICIFYFHQWAEVALPYWETCRAHLVLSNTFFGLYYSSFRLLFEGTVSCIQIHSLPFSILRCGLGGLGSSKSMCHSSVPDNTYYEIESEGEVGEQQEMKIGKYVKVLLVALNNCWLSEHTVIRSSNTWGTHEATDICSAEYSKFTLQHVLPASSGTHLTRLRCQLWWQSYLTSLVRMK